VKSFSYSRGIDDYFQDTHYYFTIGRISRHTLIILFTMINLSIFLYVIMTYLPVIFSDHRINGFVYEPTLVWTKQHVTIAFLNGDDKERLEFRRIFFEWFKCTHIHFTEVSLSQRADIRVGFRLHGARSYSLIGSLSVEYSINVTSETVFRDYQKTSAPSMIIGSITRQPILHEGGHSVSGRHEHSHALANISWNVHYIEQILLPHKSKNYIQTNYLQKAPLNKSLGPFDK
jgi:hypothetical protein